ncbi:MAG: pyruvate phosphate dikinase [Conexibacter sp.]|nr:pyruvate phosphate dikinase [Conexibacter sp.]
MTAALRSIVWIDDATDVPDGQLGGKLGSLAEMTAAGFAVPLAFGVTAEAFRLFAEGTGLVEELRRVRASLDVDDLAAVETASAELTRLIDAAPLPAALEREIRDAYAQLERRAGTPDLPVAVRSSGVSEDLEGASFAGQYDTYLWIQGADAVLAHVRRCWTGLFGPAVLTYRPTEEAKMSGDELPGMCVGVQQMVRARAAGVMFTLDPISGDRSKIVLEGCWGLGEGVVKGDVTPDRFRVDKVTLELLESDVSTQTEEYRFDEARGEVDLMPLEAERGSQPCLTEAQVLAIAELGKRVERHRKAPQDLEWAVDHDGALHLLQARPETVWSTKPQKTVSSGAEGGAVDRVLARFMSFGGS